MDPLDKKFPFFNKALKEGHKNTKPTTVKNLVTSLNSLKIDSEKFFPLKTDKSTKADSSKSLFEKEIENLLNINY
jgi:hypothetical protein